MKYLSLDAEELKELRNLRIGSVFLSMAIIMLSAIAAALVANQFIHNAIFAGITSVLVIGSGVGLVFYSNRAYISDLKQKRKKVYRGLLSSRKVTSRHNHARYEFNVDGNIFLVDEATYRRYQEGDMLEFHIAPKIKHLFRVEKID